MKPIPDSHKYLLQDETRALAYLATIMRDGTPQITTLWFNSDGEYIYISSAQGRVKDRNMRERPNVAILIQDPKDENQYIQIRGPVVEITEQGALEHMDRLCMKYRGKHWTPVEGQVRVMYKIRPDSVFVYK